MVTQELLAYIKKARETGLTEGEMRKDLLDAGWQDEEIVKALTTSDPDSSITPQKFGVTTLRSSFSDRMISEVIPQRRRGMPSFITGLAILLFVLGGGASAGWYFYFFAPKNAWARMPVKMSEITSAKYKLSIKVNIRGQSERGISKEKERQELKATLGTLQPAALFKTFVQWFGGVAMEPVSEVFEERLAQPFPSPPLEALPRELKDLEIEIRSNGIFEAVEKGVLPRFSTLFDLSVKQKGQNIGVGAEFRSLGETYYLRLVNFPLEYLSSGVGGLTPLGFLDISKYLKNWYSLEYKTLAELKLTPEASSIDSDKRQRLRDESKKLIRESDLWERELISRNASEGSHAVYQYVLTPKKEKLLLFLAKAVRIQQDRELTKTEEEQIQKFVDELLKAKISAWVDKEEYYLRRLTIVISESSIQGIAFATEISLNFDNFNEAKVERPISAIAIDEEIKKIVKGFGGSFLRGGEEASKIARDARRVTDVKQLQLALELYFDSHGRYPNILSSLAPKFIPEVPQDPSGGSAYLYSLHNSLRSYHIGASLEEMTNHALGSDKDCNSKTGVNCMQRGGRFNPGTAFDGADIKGCRGEEKRACFDVMP